MGARALAAALVAAVASPAAADEGRDAAALAALFVGDWVRADTDAPAPARTYEAVAAPGVEGRLLAVLRRTEPGLEAPVTRVALRRFRDGADGAIVHEYVFLRDRAAWGDLIADRSALASLTEDDIAVTPGCALTWTWESDRFVGATTPGACVSERIMDHPVIVEGRQSLSADAFVYRSRLTTLTGEPILRPGDGAPEIYARAD